MNVNKVCYSKTLVFTRTSDPVSSKPLYFLLFSKLGKVSIRRDVKELKEMKITSRNTSIGIDFAAAAKEYYNIPAASCIARLGCHGSSSTKSKRSFFHPGLSLIAQHIVLALGESGKDVSRILGGRTAEH